MKKKQYFLMVAKKFPVGHIVQGGLTNFKEKILSGKKLHTIRNNFQYWKYVEEEVNSSRGTLELRQWSDVPYRSPHEKIMQVESMLVQRIVIGYECGYININIDQPSGWWLNCPKGDKTFDEIIKNDGFNEYHLFESWFQNPKHNNDEHLDRCIIYFNNQNLYT